MTGDNVFWGQTLFAGILFLVLLVVLWRRHRNGPHRKAGDPTVQLIFDYMNTFFLGALTEHSKKIDDSRENENDDPYYYLSEVLKHHLKLLTELKGLQVRGASLGAGYYVRDVIPGPDLGPCRININMGNVLTHSFDIPFVNINALTDVLERQNKANEMIITMLKQTQ